MYSNFAIFHIHLHHKHTQKHSYANLTTWQLCIFLYCARLIFNVYLDTVKRIRMLFLIVCISISLRGHFFFLSASSCLSLLLSLLIFHLFSISSNSLIPCAYADLFTFSSYPKCIQYWNVSALPLFALAQLPLFILEILYIVIVVVVLAIVIGCAAGAVRNIDIVCVS